MQRFYNLMFMIFLLHFGSGVAKEEPFIPTLTVQGTATVKKAPDLLILNFSVITEAENAITALQDNNSKMSKLIDSLKNFGLKEDEIETGTFSITPVYTRPSPKFEGSFIPKIGSYQVSNTLAIRTKQIDSAGSLIDIAAKAGVNSIDSMRFDIKDSQSLKREAITEAAQNAITDALTLAKASNIKIKRMLTISLDNPGPEFPMAKARFTYAAVPESSGTPIIAGQVEAEAKVHVSFEIED